MSQTQHNAPLKMLDLFCGVGSFTFSAKLYPHLVEPVTGLDIDQKVAQTYANTYGLPTFCGDVRKLDPANEELLTRSPIDLVTAGFPCQPFSQAGKRNGVTDPTNGDLLHRSIQILTLIKPKYAIFENVMGLMSQDDGDVVRQMDELLAWADYETTWIVLNCSEWGIPQNRKRVFILCERKDVALSRCCVFRILALLHQRHIEVGMETPRLDTFLGVAPLVATRSHTLRCGGYGTHIEHSRNWAEYYTQKEPEDGEEREVYRLSQKDCEKLQGFGTDLIQWEANTSNSGKLKAITNSIPTCLTLVLFGILEMVVSACEMNSKKNLPHNACRCGQPTNK